MLGPKIYTVARAKSTKIEPIVGTGRPPNHFLKEPCACYHGRLITRKGGKFETIASLKGAVLALTDPGSTSGNALPRALFPEKIGGTSLDDYFGQIFYAGSHDAAAKAVFNGKADAAFVSENALSRAIDRGALEIGSFNHLWISPEVVSNPIVVNKNTMSPEMIAKMKGILMGMVNDEAGRAALKTVKMAAMPELTDAASPKATTISIRDGKENDTIRCIELVLNFYKSDSFFPCISRNFVHFRLSPSRAASPTRRNAST